MRFWVASFAVIFALAWGGSRASADLAVDPPGVTAPFEMKHQRGAKTHKVILPKKFLPGIKFSQVDVISDEPQVSLAGDRGRTVLAGCALSMAIGSVFVFRRRQISAAVVMVAGALALGAGSLSWADVPSPPIKSNVEISVVENGDAVIFISPAGR